MLYLVSGGVLLCIPVLYPSLIGIAVWLIGEVLVLYLIRWALLWHAVRKHGALLARIARQYETDARAAGRSPD